MQYTIEFKNREVINKITGESSVERISLIEEAAERGNFGYATVKLTEFVSKQKNMVDAATGFSIFTNAFFRALKAGHESIVRWFLDEFHLKHSLLRIIVDLKLAKNDNTDEYMFLIQDPRYHQISQHLIKTETEANIALILATALPNRRLLDFLLQKQGFEEKWASTALVLFHNAIPTINAPSKAFNVKLILKLFEIKSVAKYILDNIELNECAISLFIYYTLGANGKTKENLNKQEIHELLKNPAVCDFMIDNLNWFNQDFIISFMHNPIVSFLGLDNPIAIEEHSSNLYTRYFYEEKKLSPLEIAVMAGKLPQTNVLLRLTRNQAINQPIKKQEIISACFYAIEKGHADLFLQLLNEPYVRNELVTLQINSIKWSEKTSHYLESFQSISKYPIKINNVKPQGNVALVMAAGLSDPRIFNILCEIPDIKKQLSSSGIVAFLNATRNLEGTPKEDIQRSIVFKLLKDPTVFDYAQSRVFDFGKLLQAFDVEKKKAPTSVHYTKSSLSIFSEKSSSTNRETGIVKDPTPLTITETTITNSPIPLTEDNEEGYPTRFN